ncbi:TPA: ParM/StbA family protein [Clostridioides difficile]|uniref:ParM/StbA family protein n=1 Tax=Clostridioides TaxID=1870884 RepID=UPI00093B576C|nr:ParM/StbA family protein [Clostridioides difficile]MCC0629437.1 ParM/StbA family protein [Clostridioides sp. ES-S-0171-01]MCC0689685.1 ParM/StbA family protein [Clostridioides sp. ES-S-0056-01]MCC0716817.1 ParM/StbA family protein [Clostridioides sp. ES-S-0077-01]EGT4848622.1 ParM/StbA family protein [Clostridioides difficile]MBZ0782596.1 ParM/StbA family protein [Clostridioides difficile]
MSKLGIDIGNYAVKTSTDDIFESKVTEVKNFGSDSDSIKIGNKTYYLGEGDEEINIVKYEKENFLPLLLGAICRNTDDEVIDLALGLPVKQFGGLRKDLIEKLQGKEYHVEFAKGNETTKRDITIRSVQVFPEGVTGYLYYAKDIVDQVAGRDVVLVDIGGKTTDIALVQGNKATNPYSINVGTINIYDAIKKSLEMDERFLGKVEIKREKIQDYINKGFYLNGEKQDIKKNIDASISLFKEIYNELKLNYPVSTAAVVVMGGGAKLLGEAFKKNIPGIIVMSDVDKHVFANAKGYKKMMK